MTARMMYILFCNIAKNKIKYLLKYYAFQNIIFIDRETIIGELLPLSEDLTTGEFLP